MFTNFNKFIGFLVLGVICIIILSIVEIENLVDNQHGTKVLLYIMLSVASSYFFYNSYENLKIYKIYRKRKVYIQNDTSVCNVVEKAVLNDLEKNEYVIAYKDVLKSLHPECYNKSD